uniref:Cadherin-22 n=1 Tax=Electrophorus electricus TaxID=8005 RepID=A0A4W4DWI3_ELEEL
MWRSVHPCPPFLLFFFLLLLRTCAWAVEELREDPHAVATVTGTPWGTWEGAWRAGHAPSAAARPTHTQPSPPPPAGIRAVSLEAPGAGVFPHRSAANFRPSATGIPWSSAEMGGAGFQRASGNSTSRTVFQGAAGPAVQSRAVPRPRVRRSWIWNQFFVIEEYSGPEPVLIGRLHSSMDRGDGHTKYILTGEGAGSVFVIDSKTGNIHVTKPLDREEKDQYRLIATATDRQTGQALEASSQFLIRVQDINDNSPVFAQTHYNATVPEMASIGTSVVQVTATDADDQAYGNSARLVYSMLQGQQYFTVDPQSGTLRTAVSDMDREVQSEYVVVLQARDMGGHQGGLTGTTSVTVHLSDVNDNPPRFTSNVWSFSVSELALPGVEVGRVSATDADLGENARLDFTIADGDGGDAFNITGLNQEGVILLNKVVDYERRSLYTLSVEVQNPSVDARFVRRGPFKDRAVVRVTVLNADEPPRFSRSRYRLDVAENCPPACAVGRVTAVDPDSGLSSNIKYSIDPESDPEALFRIAPDNGLITTAMELDREHEKWHNITVIATQRDSPNQVTRVAVAIETLDLNDNAPELDRQYSTAVCDTSTPGQVIQVLRAVDRDQTSHSSLIHFSLPSDGRLTLNLTLRQGHTASLILLSPMKLLPHLTSSSHTLKIPIILRDGMSELSSTGTVTVATCPCRGGGMRTEERKSESSTDPQAEWEKRVVCVPHSPGDAPLGLSSLAVLAALGFSSALLVVTALALSVRRQKSDTLSPLEDDEIRENIITYDDEGGGEADTAAFDIATLKSSPVRPGSVALYGRFCYSFHAPPAVVELRSPMGPGVEMTTLACPLPHGLAHACGSPGPRAPVLHSSNWSDSNHSGAPPSGFPTHHISTSTITSTVATDDTTPTPVPHRLTEAPINTSQSTAPQRPLQALRTTEGALRRGGGGIPLVGTTCLYPEASESVGVYALAGRDYSQPLFMPFQGGVGLYTGGRGLGSRVGEWAMRSGSNSLTHRMGDFLQDRLAQVTYDPMQPPYDSLQTYGVEGAGSQATSLSSLESEGERQAEEAEGVDEWGPKFHTLLQIFRDRARETCDEQTVARRGGPGEIGSVEKEKERGMEQGGGRGEGKSE